MFLSSVLIKVTLGPPGTINVFAELPYRISLKDCYENRKVPPSLN